MRTDYTKEIAESEEELEHRERQLRGDTKQARVRMLLLLKSGNARSLAKCSPLVGYSLRQLSRWWKRYKQRGLEALLVDKPKLGKVSRLTTEAYEALAGEMRAGRIATLRDARKYLSDKWSIEYGSLGGVWWQLHQHKAKPKTGSRRHKEASKESQEAYKSSFQG